MTLKDDILSSDDLATKQIHAWGQVFYIRELKASELAKIQSYESGSVKQVAAFIVAAAVDENGAQIFQWSDIDKLCQKRFQTLVEVAEQIVLFNGLGADSDAEGNSEMISND